MARTKRGVVTRAKHKKVFKTVKGQYGRRKNTIRVAKQALEKAMQYAYRDRRAKKREFRSLWIQRINAGVRAEGITYSKFINGLNKSGIKLDRKVLADIAYNNPEVFKSIVKKIQFVWLGKRWKKPCNMHTEIEEQKKGNLDLYGYKE